jgi:uncharacterized protein YndB with AHSA1/START domain
MAAANSVSATTFTTPSDREIRMTRVFDAPRRLVFEAWTNPKHLPHWMLGPEGWTMPVCEIDLRPGGAWHFVWRRSDGTEMEMRGVYREIAARAGRQHRVVGRRLARDDQHVDPLRGGRQDDDLPDGSLPSKEARDAALKTGMKEGVSVSFDRLAEYLRTLA